MKFKKPTKLIACFTVIAVFLCACGVGSTPVTKEESSTNAPSQKLPDVFVENAINCPQMDDSNYVESKEKSRVAWLQIQQKLL